MSESPGIPFNALHALVQVARHGALGPAAEALGVTPGAVSQHIRRAETRAGVVLFERTARGLAPTEALLAILPDLEAGFAALARAGAGLAAPGRERVLTVTAGNVFASRWLVWRLGRFTAAHPEIELRLIATGALLDLARPDIDCGIRFGDGNWPGVAAEPLGRHMAFPVATPEIAARLGQPRDLAHAPVIADKAGMLSWSDWLAAAGVPGLVLNGPEFSDPALAFDAAVAGQGVLLALGAMADYALAHGQLVAPFATQVPSRHGYWFATARGRQLPARTRKFRAWLLAEMEGSATTPHPSRLAGSAQ